MYMYTRYSIMPQECEHQLRLTLLDKVASFFFHFTDECICIMFTEKLTFMRKRKKKMFYIVSGMTGRRS